VIEFADPSKQWGFRLARMVALVEAGDHVRSGAEAHVLAQQPANGGERLYHLACVFSQCVDGARADAKLPAAQRDKLTERYAAEGMELLRKLYDQGYFRDAERGKALANEPDLQALRGRPEFQRLVEQVKAKK